MKYASCLMSVSLPLPATAKLLSLAMWCMQAPATMDQVLLDGGGGTSVLLARIRDVEGCWLLLREVYRKFGNGMPPTTWHEHATRGKHASVRRTRKSSYMHLSRSTAALG